jgi:hypothetical protein
VIGREFELDVLEVLGNLPEDPLLDAIDEGVRAQLIAEVPEQAGRSASRTRSSARRYTGH